MDHTPSTALERQCPSIELHSSHFWTDASDDAFKPKLELCPGFNPWQDESVGHVYDTLTPEELVQATAAEITSDVLGAVRLLHSLRHDAEYIVSDANSHSAAAFDLRVAQGVLDALDLIDGVKHG